METKELINYSAAEKNKVHQIALVEDKENAVDLSKLKLVKRYFEKLEAKNIHLKDLL